MSTYEPIASQTLGSAAASVTFSSIPQGYTDLVVVASVKSSATDTLLLRCGNGSVDTGSNYSITVLKGNGSSATSARNSNFSNFYVDYAAYAPSAASTFAPLLISFNNYSNTTTYKTMLSRANNAAAGVDAIVGLWRSTSAINTLEFRYSPGTNIDSGSTFSLYGIQVGDKAQKAQGGNIVTTDGTYVYHTFTSSGAFIPSQGLTVDYLVVAGGAGGGDDNAGGGGAGGLRSTVTATGGGGSLESALSLSAGKSYPVIVGAGGTGATINGNRGTNGSDSVFHTITSVGGGGGGGDTSGQRIGNNGGSGGGGAGNSASAGGTGTTNQGYAGGTGRSANPVFLGGGGGGASAVGVTATGTQAGAGGAGVAVSISGSSVTYAGGGGGGAQSGSAGAGGSGGGGAGATSGTATAGTAFTGGGGGGGCTAGGDGGNGGSGIVIIRYLA